MTGYQRVLFPCPLVYAIEKTVSKQKALLSLG